LEVSWTVRINRYIAKFFICNYMAEFFVCAAKFLLYHVFISMDISSFFFIFYFNGQNLAVEKFFYYEVKKSLLILHLMSLSIIM